jgi:hypothetical protein
MAPHDQPVKMKHVALAGRCSMLLVLLASPIERGSVPSRLSEGGVLGTPAQLGWIPRLHISEPFCFTR